MKWTSLRGRDGVWGGDLVDTQSVLAMRDKVSHLLLGGLVQLAYERWVSPSFGWNALAVLLVAWLVELIEDHRYRKYGWVKSLSDEADGSDAVVTILGGVVAGLLL